MSYLMSTLQYAIARKRPHNNGEGRGQRQLIDFVKRTITRKLGASKMRSMRCGNLLVDARDLRGGVSRTLFIAHCDTVHREEGANRFIVKDGGRTWAANGAPLGADDGAGVAMLVNLLMHGVPGFYVFSVGEEVGGVGARAFAKLLAPDQEYSGCFDRAIAFDRRGVDSIITHQSCGMCASDDFANALAQQLMTGSDELMYLPDNTGVYTDTAEFTDYIAECTNVSCGYDREHSQFESLNIAHLQALAAAAVAVDWETLPSVRTPGDNGWTNDKWSMSTWTQTWPRKEPQSDRSLVISLCDALDFAEQGIAGPLREFMLDMADDWYMDDLDSRDLVKYRLATMTFDAELIEELWYAITDAVAGDEVVSACETFFAAVESLINN